MWYVPLILRKIFIFLKRKERKEKEIFQSRSPSPVIERKSRKSKREKKKRRRRSPSSSSSSTTVPERTSDELSEGELRRKILKKREKAMKEESSKYSDEHFHDSKDVHECSAFPPFFSASQKMTEKSGVWEEKEVVAPRIESILQNTTLKFGLESTVSIVLIFTIFTCFSSFSYLFKFLFSE